MARPAVTSDDVNDYLREITGEDITAKDFRSWAATNLAAVALRESESYDSAMKAKKNVVRAVEAASQMLGSTPTICRKCYIHPAIFDGYLDGTLLDALRRRAEEALGHRPVRRGSRRDRLPQQTALIPASLWADRY
jgi:DNA topoisomerase I